MRRARGGTARAPALLIVLALAGCATYSERVAGVRSSLAAGRAEEALAAANERLDVRSGSEVPADLEGDRPLILLERATLLQGLAEHAASARDFEAAEARLEWLDLAQGTSDDLARYLYSEEASRYRAPAHERLLLNLLNALNYLALGDLEGARVEVRRYRVIEAYCLDRDPGALGKGVAGFGNYLSGAVFEASGDLVEARRGYVEAWRRGVRGDDLRSRLVDLFRAAGPPSGDAAEGLSELAGEAGRQGGLAAAEYRRKWVDGGALVVVQAGLAPWRRPERVPIGLALTIAASVHGDRALSASERKRADRLAVEGLLKWISFPALTRDGVPGGRGVEVRVSGGEARPAVDLDVSGEVEGAWERAKGPLMVAAITRMIARVGAGLGTREAVKGTTRGAGSGRDTASAVGWLAGLAVEGLLTAADRPETRSWTTLPARILVLRATGEPPSARIEVTVAGRREAREIPLAAEGMTFACFGRYR